MGHGKQSLDEDVTNLGARLQSNTGQYVLSPSYFPTCHVLKQPRKHIFRLSGRQQFLPLYPYQEHSSSSCYLLTSSSASLPSCISRRNAVSNGVPSHFEDLLYNHMAHVQNGGTPDSYAIQMKQPAQGCSCCVRQEPCKPRAGLPSHLCRQAQEY